MPKITPYLWFDNQAEEAMNFYTSIFPNSRLGEIARYGPGGPAPEGSVISGTFYLDGQEFHTLNGGPHFKFNEAISLMVHCETQQEVDRYWNALIEGGEESMCGWLKDRYGLSWQIIPNRLGELLNDTDPDRAHAAMQAMLKMKKIDIAALEAAADSAGQSAHPD